MRLTSNFVRAKYRNQLLFRPQTNGNGGGLVRIRNNKPEPEKGEKPTEVQEHGESSDVSGQIVC